MFALDRISQGQAYLEGRDSATSLIGPHSHQSNLAVAVPRQLRGTSSSGNNAHAITPPTSHVGSAGLSSLGTASVALTEPRHPIDSGNANAAVNFGMCHASYRNNVTDVSFRQGHPPAR
jgi:hypothetical protein